MLTILYIYALNKHLSKNVLSLYLCKFMAHYIALLTVARDLQKWAKKWTRLVNERLKIWVHIYWQVTNFISCKYLYIFDSFSCYPSYICTFIFFKPLQHMNKQATKPCNHTSFTCVWTPCCYPIKVTSPSKAPECVPNMRKLCLKQWFYAIIDKLSLYLISFVYIVSSLYKSPRYK